MTRKALRELVTFRSGGTPSKRVACYWGRAIPWATVKDFTSTTLSETRDCISAEGLKHSSAKMIPKGHVIIPTRMSVGKAAINTVDLAINQDLRALIPKVKLDARFLLYAILSLKDEILARAAGATVKGITQEELYNLEIELPPLEEQVRIARMLGRAEALIAQRRQQLRQLEDLRRSLFLDLFGDPIRNERGWKTEPLGEMATLERGRFSPRPRNDPMFYGGSHPFIQTGDIARSPGGRLREYSQTLNERGARVSKAFAAGTVVMAIVGATIGETAILEIPVYAPDSVVGITPARGDAAVESVFIEYALRFWKPVLRERAPEAARANVNMETLRPLAIPVPPDRARFAELSRKVAGLQGAYQQSLADLESLYVTLSHEAFRSAARP